MANNLPKDYKLKNDDGAEYIIKEIIGSGASTIAYIAVESSTNQTRVLKEYYPSYLRITRNDDGSLQYEDRQKEKFEKGKERFVKAVETQNEIRTEVGLTNLTPPVLKIFHCNNTIYQDVIEFKGKTFDKIDSMPLLDRMRICLSISKVVERYHNAGYLCLDLKPSNILVLDSTARSKDVVNFIDFDSIRKKDELDFGDSLSYTESWSAPEQRNPYKYNKISERTDIYTIGEIVFWCTFNRNSFDDEHRGFSTYPFGENKDFSKELEERKQVQKIYTKIFRNTLRSSYKNRYSKVGELIDTLDELVRELEKRQYIITSEIRPKPFFVGREQELKKIDEALAENDIVFVSGIAGIGKSELIKQYVSAHKGEYDTVMYWTYEGDFENMICNESAVSITNFSRLQEETDSQYCERKLGKICELLQDSNNLVVIDNFNIFIDELPSQKAWNQLKGIPCKIIVSTRVNENEYKNILISEMVDIMKNIFEQNCGYNPEQEKYVEQIIESVHSHTLTVELIAKQTKATHVTPKEMYEKIHDDGISGLTKEKVHLLKDDIQIDDNVTSHIARLLSIDSMTDRQRDLMIKMAFIPTEGLLVKTFKNFFEIESYDDINWIIEHGWAYLSEGMEETISIHPIVSDVLLEYCARGIFGNIDDLYDDFIVATNRLENNSEKLEDSIYILRHIALVTQKREFSSRKVAIWLLKYVEFVHDYGWYDAQKSALDYVIDMYGKFISGETYSAIIEVAYYYRTSLLMKSHEYNEALELCKIHHKKAKQNQDVILLFKWISLDSQIYLYRIYNCRGKRIVSFKNFFGMISSILGIYKPILDLKKNSKIKIVELDYEEVFYEDSCNYNDIRNNLAKTLIQFLVRYIENFYMSFIFCMPQNFSITKQGCINCLKIVIYFRKHFDSYFDLFNNIEEKIDEARILFVIHKYQKAKGYLLELLDDYKAKNLISDIRLYYVHFFLGQIAFRTQDNISEINEYETCLAIAEQLNYKDTWNVQIEIGRLYNERGDLEKSQHINTYLMNETKELVPDIRKTYYGDSLYNMGVLHYLKGEYAQSRKMLEDALMEYKNVTETSFKKRFGLARIYYQIAILTWAEYPNKWKIKSNMIIAMNLAKSFLCYFGSVGFSHPETKKVIRKIWNIDK